MGDPNDPLSEEGLRRLHPSNTDQSGDPQYYKNRLDAWKRLKENAPREYRDMLAQDDLDITTESEGPFLAKMYLVAKYTGDDVRFYNLLSRPVKLRADRVLEAAEVFRSLSNIYRSMGDHLGSYWDAVHPEHWAGEGADSYSDEIGKAITHINGKTLSLHEAAKNTGLLMEKFADALIHWRKSVASAIRKLAALDREKAFRPDLLEIPSDDPIGSAAKTLKVLLDAFDRAHRAGEESDHLLKKFATSQDINFKFTSKEIEQQRLTNPDPWSGSLRAG